MRQRRSPLLTHSTYGLPPIAVITTACIVACSSEPRSLDRQEAPIIEAGVITVPNVCGPDPTAPPPIPSSETLAGYLDQKSYFPANIVRLRLSANPTVSGGNVEVFRFTGTAGGYHDSGGMEPKGTVVPAVTMTTQSIPGNASHCGAGWGDTAQFTIPSDWKSGLYAAKINGGGASIWIPFVVKATTPKGLLIVAATNTWEAYNDWPLRLTSSECTSADPSCKKLQGETFGFYVPPVGRPGSDWWTAHSYYAPMTTKTPTSIAGFPRGEGISITPVLT